jgi:hypothetical protein
MITVDLKFIFVLLAVQFIANIFLVKATKHLERTGRWWG